MLCAGLLVRDPPVKKRVEVIKSLTFTANLLQALRAHLCAHAHAGSLPAHTECELQGPPPALAGLGISSGCIATCACRGFFPRLYFRSRKMQGKANVKREEIMTSTVSFKLLLNY